MREATNTPYLRRYDEQGKLIKGTYRNDGSNRRNRKLKEQRSFNNKKHYPMVISQTGTATIHRFVKSRQVEFDKDGNIKVINHLVFRQK